MFHTPAHHQCLGVRAPDQAMMSCVQQPVSAPGMMLGCVSVSVCGLVDQPVVLCKSA